MRNFQGIILYEYEHLRRFSNLHSCTFILYTFIPLCLMYQVSDTKLENCRRRKIEKKKQKEEHKILH